MKTKLLSFIFTMVLFTSILNAQTKIWDFGNDTTTWPVSAGIPNTGPIIVDNLGLHPVIGGTANFAAINANVYTFTDGFTTVNRFQLNGGGSTGGTYLPTQRYLFVNVSGACTINVWFRTGGSGARNLFITDGTNLIATAGSSTSGDAFILTGTISAAQAAAGKIYVYGDTACNLYKMSVVGATVTTTLANPNFQTESTVNVFSNGSQISIANVLSKTQVEVYSMTGALVKSFTTDTDTSFDMLSSGVYVVNVASAEGKKTVKVAVK